jgi:hypothetical protein
MTTRTSFFALAIGFAAACGGSPSPTGQDSGQQNLGPDAGDAGEPDSETDTSPSDAGSFETGTSDGGTSDGGACSFVVSGGLTASGGCAVNAGFNQVLTFQILQEGQPSNPADLQFLFSANLSNSDSLPVKTYGPADASVSSASLFLPSTTTQWNMRHGDPNFSDTGTFSLSLTSAVEGYASQWTAHGSLSITLTPTTMNAGSAAMVVVTF